MKKRKRVEETALSTAWAEALTGPARPSQIAAIAAQFPGQEPIQIALEDLYPLVMSPDNYDDDTLTEVVGSILGELEHRGYVDQTFENDLMSYYFGDSAEDLRDQVRAEKFGLTEKERLLNDLGTILNQLDDIDPDLDLNDHPQFSNSRDWAARTNRASLAAADELRGLAATPEPFRLIGLCGAAGSGKDTAAAFLVAAGWTRIAFADPLKAVLYDMHVTVEPDGLDPTDLSALVDEFGWDTIKEEVPEARALLQRLGVATRDHVHSDAWLNAAFAKMQPGGKYVYSDARFPNECAAIHSSGGKLVLIERPAAHDLGANAGHVSETAWRDQKFDETVLNTGTLAELGQIILGLAS